MIKYKSTRGDKTLYTFSEAVLKGIAKDGGLFVPEKLPTISASDLKSLRKKSYQARAVFLFNLFETDFTKSELEKLVDEAYSHNFDTKKVVPLVNLKDNQFLLELWHGPTAAFKDMALQLMPLFFEQAVWKNKSNKQYLILTATSGDTGTAAAHGFKNKEHTALFVFYPANRVSQIQELQMTTQEGENIEVYAVDGDFDAVQTMVKDIFNDKEFDRRLLSEFNTVLSAANSINWGRLIAQIVYHISSYLDLVDTNVITLGEPIDIAVPSGNFGNILAAFYAKKTGLPIRRLICASNENNALTKFLETGIYDIRDKKLVQTPSPAMDILIASNIERLVHIITSNPEKISSWMNNLKTQKKFEVDEQTKAFLKKEFYAGWISNDNCLKNIKDRYEETGYLMDPHTSVAQLVAEGYLKKEHSSLPIIISSTAHWSKFPHDVYRALTKKDIEPSSKGFEIINLIQKLAPDSSVPSSIRNLQHRAIRHNKHCENNPKKTEELITQWLNQRQ